MSEPTQAALIARPEGSTCLCGTPHYGSSDRSWLVNWCGNQCCWTQETCRKCGAVYTATTGALLHPGRVRSGFPEHAKRSMEAGS